MTKTAWCRSRIGACFTDSYEVQVASAHQKKGLGRWLMAALERVAMRGGMCKVVLTVFIANGGARRFYRRHGYTTDETSPEEDEGEGTGAHAYVILSKALRERAEHPG